MNLYTSTRYARLAASISVAILAAMPDGSAEERAVRASAFESWSGGFPTETAQAEARFDFDIRPKRCRWH